MVDNTAFCKHLVGFAQEEGEILKRRVFGLKEEVDDGYDYEAGGWKRKEFLVMGKGGLLESLDH